MYRSLLNQKPQSVFTEWFEIMHGSVCDILAYGGKSVWYKVPKYAPHSEEYSNLQKVRKWIYVVSVNPKRK